VLSLADSDCGEQVSGVEIRFLPNKLATQPNCFLVVGVYTVNFPLSQRDIRTRAGEKMRFGAGKLIRYGMNSLRVSNVYPGLTLLLAHQTGPPVWRGCDEINVRDALVRTPTRWEMAEVRIR